MKASETPQKGAHQPVTQQRQGTASLASPQGEHLAQLEAMANDSPQADGLAQLAAAANHGRQATAQRRANTGIHHSPRATAQRQQLDGITGGVAQSEEAEETLQPKVAQREEAPARPNNTGLPDNLKSGIESLSGMSMDNVKVHYNSSQPAQLNAHAYAQGTDIHVAPGKEQHLPHEAWHVVQQAQGRVQPTMQMKSGVNVNDDQWLEKEADVMGAKASQFAPNTTIHLQQSSLSNSAQILQRAKYARNKESKVVYRRGDNGRINNTEDEVDRKAYQQYLFDELFKGKAKSIAPTVMGTATESDADRPHRVDLTDSLIYRGMSANNVANREDEQQNSVFTVQNPNGQASAVSHIVHDDPNSPYLSFEANGLNISSGKYAHKPVDEKNQSLGVTTDANGFLKQEKSYTQDNIEDKYAGKKRIGVVAGIFNNNKYEKLDVSTEAKARQKLNPRNSPDDEKRAVDLAVADKEILVKPGPNGIAKGDVPFYAKVETITEQEFIDNIDNQTPTMALGYHKPSYYKIQIDTQRSNAKFHFLFNLDDKYQNGGDQIAGIDDVQINKGLFSLPAEKQDRVRDEMPGHETELDAIGSDLARESNEMAQKKVSTLRTDIGPALHNRVLEIVIWFENFEDDEVNTVDELKNFDVKLRMLEQKSKIFWDRILKYAEWQEIEAKLTITENQLEKAINGEYVQKINQRKFDLESFTETHTRRYNEVKVLFNKIKNDKNAHIPQIQAFQSRLEATAGQLTQLR